MIFPPGKSPHSNSGVVSTSLLILLDELIAEILSRLPVKTLMQMKCVCKSLKTLISHPFFAKLHLHRSPRNTHVLLSPIWYDAAGIHIMVVPIPVSRWLESPFEYYEPYSYRLRYFDIPNDPCYILRNMDCNHIVGSCNGLICLGGGSRSWPKHWFRLWNPVTNTLSEKLGNLTNYFRLTFGYDIINDIYKVVAFSANTVKVFSLRDNVWRDIPSFPIVPFDIHRIHCRRLVDNGVYVSGSINWLAIRDKTEYEWNDITIKQFVIVSLDLDTETYRQLLPPSGFVEVPPVEPSVSVLMDCLCFSHRFRETHFVIWKMMEFGVQESWTQFLKISFQNLHIDYGIGDSLAYYAQLFLLPLCVSESSNTLVMASNQRGLIHGYHRRHAILYNWRDNKVEQIATSKQISWFNTNDYVESLVSTS
ncbi:F-box protein interaction domain protein [Medicago truncatula]|uniref:F-box protein interaction domain protein n=1 Tax=Medicago truncatula TaxID=3880 RepID=A0A072V702_MEDTR|nr:F-box protein interaction domain protein [Medicago truncatula]